MFLRKQCPLDHDLLPECLPAIAAAAVFSHLSNMLSDRGNKFEQLFDFEITRLYYAQHRGIPMIVEKRTYTFHPGKLAEFLTLYEKEAFEVHTSYLPLIGYFTTDIGMLNQAVSLWGYASMAERDEKRARLYADPRWIAFAPKATPLIQKMETEILLPTKFSPIR